jgi:excisionase family DNA binding protein
MTDAELAKLRQIMNLLLDLMGTGAALGSVLNMPDDPALWDVATVALKLNVSPTYIYRMVRAGKLVAVHLGHTWRFRPSDVAQFIRMHQNEKDANQ